jgi:ABC-type transport system involved in multi-copper enzyme maturation permease subunit
MKKEDIQQYLLSEDKIKDIKLKEQVDNSIIEELHKLTPKIQMQKYNEYNIKDYSKLVESNGKRHILGLIQSKIEVTLSISYPSIFGFGLCPIVLLLMDYFRISRQDDIKIYIFAITILICLYSLYVTYKNNKLLKIVKNNLKSLEDVNNEE